MNTNRMQTLGARSSNRKIRAHVTIHAHNYAAGTTVCGITYAELAAQEFNIQQTSICGSNSDLNCAACIKGGALQIVEAGKPYGSSRAKLYHVKRGGVLEATITDHPALGFALVRTVGGVETYFDTFMEAWRSIMQPA